MTNMVVREIGGRRPQAEATAGAMKSRCETKLDTFLPHRVVIIIAVERENVVPDCCAAGLAVAGVRWNRPPDYASHHDCFQTELLDVLQLGDSFVRRVHRNSCSRSQSAGIFAERVGDIRIERAAGSLPNFVIPDRIDA